MLFYIGFHIIEGQTVIVVLGCFLLISNYIDAKAGIVTANFLKFSVFLASDLTCCFCELLGDVDGVGGVGDGDGLLN